MSSNKITLSDLSTTVTTFIEAQNEHNATVNALLARLTTPTKATKKGKKAKAAAPKATAPKAVSPKVVLVDGPTFVEQRASLVALKAKGEAPAGMTVVQAVEAGLLKPTRVERVVKADGETVTQPVLGKKASKADGTPFSVLKEALKAHKASGAVPSQHNGTFVTVKSAIADGLMNADGTVGTAKAPKAPKANKGQKAKGAQVIAKVTDAQAAAASAPRRADGTITPKREWALREELALKHGRTLDRHQIDAKVAEAMAILDA